MAEVSDIWIKLNYWYLNNRRDLTRWWAIVLLGLDLILVAFVVTNGISALIGHSVTDKWISEIGSSRMVSAEATTRNTPKDIEIASLESVADGKGQFIYLATLQNPNTFWSVKSVTLEVSGESGTTDSRQTLIPAGETRVVLFGGSAGANAQLNMTDMKWERTPKSKLPEILLDFTQAQHNFVTAQSTSGNLRAISQVTTTVTNNSLYTIKSIKVVVVARNGNNLVSAKQFFVENLEQRESRDLVFQFPNAIGQFSSITFYPEVDILNSKNLEI